MYALRGNRRLFVWRVMAYFGVCSTIVVNLLQRDDPMLERVRFDHYRMRREAPEWARIGGVRAASIRSFKPRHLVRIGGLV